MRGYHLLFILLLQFNAIYSQPDLKFAHYKTQQGLVNNEVLCITQDQYGFLWFGTKNGCSRFDGIEFKTFQYDENILGSIGLGWVNQIVCDNKNRLWFAIAGQGSTFMRYDYDTEKFTDYSSRLKDLLDIKGEIFDVWNIYIDSDGYIWIAATNIGIVCYNPEKNEIRNLSKEYVAKSFFEDADKNIWFVTLQGIVVYNKTENTFKHYQNELKDTKGLSSNSCTKVFQDSREQIWVATYGGLNKLIITSSGSVAFEHFKYNSQNPYSLSSNLVYDINEDVNGNLLIATVNGLCLMDSKTQKIYRYYSSEIDKESVNANLIRAIYRDHHDNIWIGTNSGVGKLQVKNFKKFSHSAFSNSISHNKVQYLYEDQNSNIWIATPKGIDIFDRKYEKFEFITGVGQSQDGLYGAPITLGSDNEGMWIGTWSGGLSKFDYTSKTITGFFRVPEINSEADIFAVLKDSKKRLWVGVSREGVYVYNKESGAYKKIANSEEEEKTLSSNRITTIIEDSESDIWIGTRRGLNMLLDFETASFKHYLEGVRIKSIVEGTDKNLWVGTAIGLYKLDKETQEITKFDTRNGLPGNDISGILEEQPQRLWISSNKGLFRTRFSGDSLIELITYRDEEGLNVGNFLDRSCTKLADGTMLFGGSEGFCMFHPSNVKTDTLSPTVVITKLKIVNKEIAAGQEINGQIVLQKSITETKQLVLNHKNNAFTIEFAGLQYNMPQYTSYCYKLDGYDLPDSDWHFVSAKEKRAEYMNLSGGDYIFKVKSANSHGIWNHQVVELKITILPPWWKTRWFTTLWICLVVVLIMLFVRLRTINLQRQKKKLKTLVEQRTLELREMNEILQERQEELVLQGEQMSEMNSELTKTVTDLESKTIEVENMAKQLHESDQLKLKFFANISHEFRTPLSLIIGPLEKCIKLEKPVDWDNIKNNYLLLMHRNSKRLLRLINQIIDFRKIDQNEKKLNISNNNIIEFTQEVVEVFSTYAESKNINLKYTIEDLGFKKDNQLIINSGELIDLSDQKSTIKNQQSSFYNNFWFDPDIMEKVLYNLISNAIKYTPKGGEVNVQLTVSSKRSLNNEELIINNENTENDQFFILHYSPLAHENAALSSSFLIIKVSDTGVGISTDNLSKIFDRFYRIETKESFTEEGTGIGLSYTQELIELHNGKIFVESQLGKGTIFSLTFPIGSEHFEKNSIKQDSIPVNLNYIRSMVDSIGDKFDNQHVISGENIETKKEKRSVLIVEDNIDLREFIKNDLSFHYTVHEAENGKQGLELAIELEPEIIISDVMMPIMDGIELCDKLKTNENTSHIPLILLTAKGSDEDQIKGLETGADDYITKPFNIDILKIKIQNIFFTREQLQEKYSQSIDVVPSEITHSIIDQEFLQKAIEVIEENIQDIEFDNDAFIEQMNYSKATIYRKFKSITNQSVSEFIRTVRLKTAAKLFLEGNDSVSQVCYQVGFKYPTILTRYFTKMFNKSPRDFIKERLKSNSEEH